MLPVKKANHGGCGRLSTVAFLSGNSNLLLAAGLFALLVLCSTVNGWQENQDYNIGTLSDFYRAVASKRLSVSKFIIYKYFIKYFLLNFLINI
jgi:hypothetical protein